MITVKRRLRKRNRRRRLGTLEREILDELTLGDLLYAHLLSGRSTKRYFKLSRERATYRHRRKLAIERLIEHSYILEKEERLSITKVGEDAIGSAVKKNLESLKATTWDGKWRIAAFDIPEKYAPLRNTVRGILKQAGFVKLQHSIWIFPHDCESLVRLIKERSELSSYLLYGVLDRIEGEGKLKKIFRL